MTAPLSVVEIVARAINPRIWEMIDSDLDADAGVFAREQSFNRAREALSALSAAGYVVVKEEALNDFINETLSNIAGIGLEVDSTLGRAKEHRAMLQAQQEDLGQP